MDKVRAGLPFIFIYLDDILIASPDEVSHHQHLQVVFGRLRDHGLILNLSKCVFGQSAVDFLGHRVSEAGAEPLTKHLEAIQSFPQPHNSKDLQSFWDLSTFTEDLFQLLPRFCYRSPRR
jgi:hypothetical protein